VALINDHKDLIVWRKAMMLAKEAYVVSSQFPWEERFGLTSQLRRAVVSVCSNIAEGHARRTTEFRHYLSISRGSLAEAETQLLLAVELGFVSSVEIEIALALIEEVGRMLSALARRIGPARSTP
jgi:four helix bundle protein